MTDTRQRLERIARARSAVRDFFARRNVLEVGAPVAGARAVTDPQLESICFRVVNETRYLQTSPEFALKRLLAQGSGDIYSLGTVFRDDEQGRWHSPEFTMLEWYRLGFDHHDLMDEVESLVQSVWARVPAVDRVSHQKLYQEVLGLDSLSATVEQLKACAQRLQDCPFTETSRVFWLDLLWAIGIEPALQGRACFVYDFPIEQAALARLGASKGQTVAHRFELVINGVELANGFWELTDADEQQRRFEADNLNRERLGQPRVEPDERLLQALHNGLPDCAGVALGFDRLVALSSGFQQVSDALALSWDRA
ncbi:MAG: EF-P lysine aminoacylase EpmA [Halieaceae bacterium]|nr:EF-P lysine aminoacylase EpmA [Halieaceae bacterium]